MYKWLNIKYSLFVGQCVNTAKSVNHDDNLRQIIIFCASHISAKKKRPTFFIKKDSLMNSSILCRRQESV